MTDFVNAQLMFLWSIAASWLAYKAKLDGYHWYRRILTVFQIVYLIAGDVYAIKHFMR